MGKLIYGFPETKIEFEDRLLAHLKLAINTKLRRDESFTISWQRDEAEGGGRETLLLHPAIPLQFIFNESEQPELNRRWAEALTSSDIRDRATAVIMTAALVLRHAAGGMGRRPGTAALPCRGRLCTTVPR